MANVKVRKQRHLKNGSNPNPFPTLEQIATGVAGEVAERVAAKAAVHLVHVAKNIRASTDARRGAPRIEVIAPTSNKADAPKVRVVHVVDPKNAARVKAKAKLKKKSKTAH